MNIIEDLQRFVILIIQNLRMYFPNSLILRASSRYRSVVERRFPFPVSLNGET